MVRVTVISALLLVAPVFNAGAQPDAASATLSDPSLAGLAPAELFARAESVRAEQPAVAEKIYGALIRQAEADGSTATAERARAFRGAFCRLVQQEYRDAMDDLSRARWFFQSSALPEREAMLALIELHTGIALAETGDPREALRSFQRSAERYRRVDDAAGRTRSLILAAEILAQQGFYADAEPLFRQAEETVPAEADALRSRLFLTWGVAQQEEGRHREARNQLRWALDAALQTGDTRAAAEASRALGALLIEMGDIDRARDFVGNALRMARSSGNPRLLTDLTFYQARLDRIDGEDERARARAMEALERAADGGLEPEMARIHGFLADLLMESGHSVEVVEHLVAERSLRQRIHQRALDAALDVQAADFEKIEQQRELEALERRRELESQVIARQEAELARRSEELRSVRVIQTAMLVGLIVAVGIVVALWTTMRLRKRAYEAMRQARDEAREASRAKSQFLAVMSHEIRTPLNAVIGMASALEHTRLDEGQREQVSLLKAGGDHLHSIISDILDFSKIESGQMDLDLKPMSPRQIFGSGLGSIRPLARERNLEVISEVADDVPRRIYGDAVRVRQILINLLSNAVKFTQSGRITARMSVESGTEGWLVITVADTGIGIPRSRLEVLFEPFRQIDSSTSRSFGGTGLGLAICRKLTDLMGGRIEAVSTPGEGSCFTVRIPLEPAPDEPDVPETEELGAAEIEGGGPLRVLVVDDHRVNLRVAEIQLTRMGCVVTACSTGEEGIRQAVEGQFDVILMDLQMPGVNGFEATARIREHFNDSGGPAIFAFSAAVTQQDREEADRAGVDGFIAKPVQFDALRSALASARSAAGEAARRRVPASRGSRSPFSR